VTFLGFLEDTSAFYRAIDVAVVPSTEEPLGRIPLEAAAHGKPSIANAVGGLPEIIQDRQTGWLVPPGDGARLRQALADFVERPAPEIGTAARAWVETISDPQRYVERLADIYGSLTASTVPHLVPC
jgi:glycosyltransferase involved in cell wall biosynthesis